MDEDVTAKNVTFFIRESLKRSLFQKSVGSLAPLMNGARNAGVCLQTFVTVF